MSLMLVWYMCVCSYDVVEATQGYGRDRRLHVTLQDESAEQTVNSQLVRDGFVKVATNIPAKLKDLVSKSTYHHIIYSISCHCHCHVI